MLKLNKADGFAAPMRASVALSLVLSTAALAQDAPPPPEQDTVSSTGVSLVSGGYSTSATDLSIGQGEFPQALTLTREYSSSLNDGHALNDGLRGWGWATNLHMFITVGELGGGDFPPDEPLPTNQQFPWRYGVSVGTGSIASFVELDPLTDPIVGPNYEGPFGKWDNITQGQLLRSGEDLIYVGIDGTRHLFEGGSRQTFRDNIPTFRTRLEAPDGTVLRFHGALGARSVFSNRGIALLFEYDSRGLVWTRACAVNLAKHFVTPTSNCPSGVPTVRYQHTTLPGPPLIWKDQLTSFTNQVGETTPVRVHFGSSTALYQAARAESLSGRELLLELPPNSERTGRVLDQLVPASLSPTAGKW